MYKRDNSTEDVKMEKIFGLIFHIYRFRCYFSPEKLAHVYACSLRGWLTDQEK